MLSTFIQAQATHAIDDKAYHKHQANPSASDGRPAKVKPATAKHKQKNKYE